MITPNARPTHCSIINNLNVGSYYSGLFRLSDQSVVFISYFTHPLVGTVLVPYTHVSRIVLKISRDYFPKKPQ